MLVRYKRLPMRPLTKEKSLHPETLLVLVAGRFSGACTLQRVFGALVTSNSVEV